MPQSLGFGGGLPSPYSPQSNSERYNYLAPVFLSGPFLEVAFDGPDDLPELAVIKRPDEDDASMCALRLGPFPRKRREVAAVAGDEHTVPASGEFEYGRIV